MRRPRTRMAGGRLLIIGSILTVLSIGCLDSPYGRAATMVDGSGFPPEVRGALLPGAGYAGGQSADIYVFGPAPTSLAGTEPAIVFTELSGQPLPACQTGLRDGDGQLLDVDLDQCQAPLLPALPGDPDYSPIVRLASAVVPDDYRLNQVRSGAELADLGVTAQPVAGVTVLAVVDPNASLIDPAGRMARNLGWFDTLQVVYLDLGDQVPVMEDDIQAMELLVPEGAQPGAPGTIAQARSGLPGYSNLCNISYFQIPMGYQPGDYANVSEVPDMERIPPDPAEFSLCAVY